MHRLIIVLLLSLCARTAVAQKSEPFTLGTTEHLHSAILKQDRKLNIYLPPGYNENGTYSVIYLLDGSADEDFIHIVGVVQFLTMIEQMPKTIVIGIANGDRKHDFTFPTTILKDKTDYPTTGSSAQFIRFIEEELQPYVHKRFHVATNILIGQSLGGLLATEILLKKPDLFDRYLIVSPSLWWDNESLLTAAPTLLQKPDVMVKNIYIAVGSEGAQMEDDAAKLKILLDASGHHPWKVKLESLPKDDHLTILHHAAYNGLEFFYPRDTTAHH